MLHFPDGDKMVVRLLREIAEAEDQTDGEVHNCKNNHRRIEQIEEGIASTLLDRHAVVPEALEEEIEKMRSHGRPDPAEWVEFHDGEACGLHCLHDPKPREVIVVLWSKMHRSGLWNEENRMSAWLEHSRNFMNHAQGFEDVFEDLQAENGIEGVVPEGHLTAIAANEAVTLVVDIRQAFQSGFEGNPCGEVTTGTPRFCKEVPSSNVEYLPSAVMLYDSEHGSRMQITRCVEQP